MAAEAPSKLSLADYERATREIIEFFSSVRGLRGLYQYGTVKAPGLSDIDLLVVLEDDFADREAAAHMLRDFPVPRGFEQLLSNGSFKVLPASAFRRLDWLGPLDLRLLHGQETPREPVPEKDREAFAICLVLDWLAERLGTVLRHHLDPGTAVVARLGDLYSFQHSVTRALSLLKRDPGPFLERLRSLRDGWFERSAEQNRVALDRLLGEGVVVGFDLMADFAAFLTSGGWIPDSRNQGGSVWLNPGMRFAVTKTVENPRDWSLSHSTRERIELSVPDAFLSYIRMQADAGGPVGRLLASNWEGEWKTPGNSRLRAIAECRVSLINDLVTFTVNNGFSRGQLYRCGHLRPFDQKGSAS